MNWKTLWLVSKWEFSRFFKLKDLLTGLFIMIIFAIIGGLAGIWLTLESFEIPDIAIINYGVFSPDSLISDEFNFIDHSHKDADQLKEMIYEKDINAILCLKDTEKPQIILMSTRAWLLVLENFLQDLYIDYKLKLHEIDKDLYKGLREGINLNAEFIKGSKLTTYDKVLAGGSIVLVLAGVFIGFAYQFTAISSEKQQRITEQVISSIAPQTWIDGKIIGISAIGLVYIVFYGSISIIGAFIAGQFGLPLGPLLSLINPFLIIKFAIMALLGIYMWNSFFAGLAATIDDPNTSEKTSWMMFPLLPIALSFYSLINPDTFAIKFLGIFPLSSYAVLPARMILTHVPLWHYILAVVLLFLASMTFRFLAGRIFSIYMLMYGKEPNIREIFQCIRKVLLKS